jgi:rSAM/selenodomain-associated transferase 1
MSSGAPEITVVVFARAPEPGRAKTRLIPALGEAGAAELQARLVRRALETAVAAAVGPVELWCAPHAAFPFFQECARSFPVRLRGQGPGDLGEKMLRACREVLTRAGGVILMGTDCPALSSGDLAAAAGALPARDAVITPAEDGGYVLIGLRRAAPALFEKVSWGSSEVLEQTRGHLRRLGWSWAEMPALWDLDRPRDLQRLAAEPGLAHLLTSDAA